MQGSGCWEELRAFFCCLSGALVRLGCLEGLGLGALDVRGRGGGLV